MTNDKDSAVTDAAVLDAIDWHLHKGMAIDYVCEPAENTHQPTQSDALLEGDTQTILYLLGVRHGREDERAKIAAEASQPTQSDALKCEYCDNTGICGWDDNPQFCGECSHGDAAFKGWNARIPVYALKVVREKAIEECAKALEADAMKCDCAAVEERECGCGAWCEWKSITSARAVEIVRALLQDS